MKNYLSNIALILSLLSISMQVKAQNDAFSTQATVGVTSPLLDNGIGFHLGINPAYALSDFVAIEGQLSYIYSRVTGSFLSGRTGNQHAVNLLAGGRVYLISSEKRTHLYVNALLGGNYFQENMTGLSEQQELNLGFSVGAFVGINRLLIGLSFDTPQYVVLKVGIRL